MSNSQWGPAGGQYPPPQGPPVGIPPQQNGTYPPPGGDRGASFGWGPQFGPGGPEGSYFAPGGPRPKKRNTGLAVSLAVLGGLVVTVAVFVILATRDADTGTTTRPSPTFSTAAPGPTAAPTPSRLPTTRPTSVLPTQPPSNKPTSRPPSAEGS